ncbi:protein of unknown function [Pseudorhizobium banfieldiae]|uniref:Uncharacterized protein n=1 Tax=Pseudorhizobium banfieldiae TaxID=1125847 RepID=L0NI90_9HYPH|nr:protein of unknown function [Pseudorhizobium banfieldiae]
MDALVILRPLTTYRAKRVRVDLEAQETDGFSTFPRLIASEKLDGALICGNHHSRQKRWSGSSTPGHERRCVDQRSR